ncbi:MAG: preprotein translocase subunit SecE [Nitrospirota bacterium]
MIEKIKEFLKEVRGEIKRITFPSKEETFNSTVVVIVIVVIVSVFLSVADIGLTKAVKFIIK